MTDLPVENKQNWILEFFKSVWKFILKLLGLDGVTRKCVWKSSCTDSCCCEDCDSVIVINEKEEDNGDIDIRITPKEIDIA